MLVCVEKIQSDGVLIKLHDLKLLLSEEFYLLRQENGQLARTNPSEVQQPFLGQYETRLATQNNKENE